MAAGAGSASCGFEAGSDRGLFWRGQLMAKQSWLDRALRWPLGILAIVLTVVAIGAFAVRDLNYALDFTGGTLVELVYEEPVALQGVRDRLTEAGYPGAVVVHFGSDSDVLIRMAQADSSSLGERILGIVGVDREVELKRSEYVGPQVGEQLREQGGLALLLALGMIMLYIAMRFQFKFAVGAAVSTAHDAIVVVGCFALFQWEFDLTVLAAVMAVIGYSINDTIVVYDRIRENCRQLRIRDTREIIDVSVTQTLGRTLATSVSTLLALLALFYFGGDMMRGFSVALIIGIVVGTFSSIYVAAPMLLVQNFQREDLLVPEKEGAQADGLP